MSNLIHTHISRSLAALEATYDDVATLDRIAICIAMAIDRGFKVVLAGNGGSAADANHIAAEFVGRFKIERAGYSAISLASNEAIITAISNDYSFDNVFARQVRAIARPGDVFIALTTSGRSPNILRALGVAKNSNIFSVAFTGVAGLGGNSDSDRADMIFRAHSSDSAVVQQVHMTALHAICAEVERKLSYGTP